MWKEISNYEGYYEVSDSGEVRSIDRFVENTRGKQKGKRRFLKGSIMRQTDASGENGTGYLVVNLHRDGVSRVEFVHVLVAQSFIPNPDCLPTVNHIDGDKHNNSVLNLEWASFADNNKHALLAGLRKPRGNEIAQYTRDGRFIRTYRSTCEAARINSFSRGSISHCLNGRTKTACGFIWKKESESATTIPSGSTREDELPAEAQRPLG